MKVEVAEEFLIFTDLQFKEDRIEDQKVVFTLIRDMLEDHTYKGLIFAGDLFDDRKSVSSLLLKEFTKFLDSIYDLVELIFLIAGNHDKPYDDAMFSYFRPYKNWSKIKIAEADNFYHYKSFAFIPFLKEEKILEALKEIRMKYKKSAKEIKYLITHLGISGIPVDSGKVIKNKMTVEIFKKTFPNLQKIISGHYHTRKEYKDGFVYYLGNPISLSHNEEQVKGVHSINTEGKLEFIPFTKLPMYKTFRFHCNVNSFDKARRIIKKQSNNYIRFIFFDEKEKLTSVPKDELHKLAEKYKLRALKIKLDFPEKDSEDSKKEIVFKEDIFDLYEEYVSSERLHSNEIKYGRKILQGIINNESANTNL